MDGVILINKEKGCTSHDVVNKVKHITNEKVGHTGTLDPNATGLLPLLIGKGTKLSYYLINHDKEYKVTLKLGMKTDTADEEGIVIEKQEVDSKILREENIENILNSFLGKQMQTPPKYSAIKINGKKLYEYARKNIEVEIKPRQIEIYNIHLNKVDTKEEQIQFTVQCSKGTYIRSLCEDIAKSLGTIGYMKELNRTKVGIFNIEDSITIKELEKNEDNLTKYLITIEDLFYRIYNEENKITLNKKQLELYLNGVKLSSKNKDGMYGIYDENYIFIGIGSVQKGLLKREVCI